MAAEPAPGGRCNPGHILCVGERLAPIARQAFAGAALEVGGASALAGSLQRFDLIIVDCREVEPSALAAALSAVSALGGGGPAVLLAAGQLPSAVIRSVLALPRSDILEPPFTSVDLAAAAMRLASRAGAAGGDGAAGRQSACWTVTGAVGGCGATTLAVEILASVCRRGKARGAALIDLNLAGGAAAAYLGVAANMDLAGRDLDPERIDAALLDAFAVKTACGGDLLAAPRDPRAFSRIGPATIVKVLEAACEAYEFVVVDLPRRLEAWTLDVLAGADENLLVSELTVPALLAARDLAGEIETELQRPTRPRIVLNRLSPRLFGLAPSLAEAEKALQRKAEAAISSDWEAAAACANLGGAVGQLRPRSKIVRDIDALVDRLWGREAAALPQRARA